MRYLSHACRLLYEVLRFSIASHRLSLLLVVLLGGVLLLLLGFSHTVAPLFVFYPFA